MNDSTEEPDYTALQLQWEEEVKNNPKTQEFLEPYSQSCLEHMYKQYALSKMLAVKYAKYYRDQNEGMRNQWVNSAAEHLSFIQQKKLFDAQCKWRANQETFEGVEICYDFIVLEHDVMNCHFIEQPTTYDINLYSEYLTSSNNVELDLVFDNDWQDYTEFKEAYDTNEENRNLPAWYEFHNSRTGNGILLTLPDVKGKQERVYLDLAIKEKTKNQPPEEPYNPPANKPFINYFDKQIHLDLAKQIENKEMVTVFKEYIEATAHKGTWENEKAEENFNYLSEMNDELIPIEAHQDYRVALQIACDRFRCKKIAQHLPLALEQYQTNRQLKQMGIDSYKEKKDFRVYLSIRKMIADDILLGRKANNEPLDFDF